MTTTKKILIVEDEPALQDAFKLILELDGYTVFTAQNGLVGLESTRTHRPDLVLLDIFMPVMDGKEFLRNIDLDAYPTTKIIVYSNLSDQRTEAEARELGAHDFVLKSSMTPRDLLELVKKHLKK
jgi:DNA-binding response OmpR family regulator